MHDDAPHKRIALRVDRSADPVGAASAAETVPLRAAVPWPHGALNDTDSLSMRDPQAACVPIQVRALDRWPDDSIRWLLVTWVACLPDEACEFTLRVNDPDSDQDASTSIRERRNLSAWTNSDALSINTGSAQFIVDTIGTFPLRSAILSGVELLAETRLSYSLDQPVSLKTLSVVDDGPVMVSIEARGSVGPLEVVHLLNFYAGLALVHVETTLLNAAAAEHPGGTWPLGAGGHVSFDDLSVHVIPTDTTNSYIAKGDGATESMQCSDALLYQASSGGEQWDSHNHVDANNKVNCQFKGYRLTVNGQMTEGLRATPTVWQGLGNCGVAVGCRYFWQNFPKTLSVSSTTGIRLGLWPSEAQAPHELQGGEQKTHAYWLAFGALTTSTDTSEPVVACPSPRWVADSNALAYLSPVADGEDTRLGRIRDDALTGPNSFAAKREIIDEYGWRNFGDLYADHEAAFYDGDAPFISHYNNQYDPLWGCLVRFLVTADGRWFTIACEQASHVRDIDIYHTTKDRWPYNLGLFWHTNHYVQAGRATHRAFDPDLGAGGGPAAEHLYSSGLKLHYLLTGDMRSRRHVIDFGDYVINSDDGRLQKFGFISWAPTGYVSASGTADYHGPGRGPGNAIVALLEAFDLSRDRRYLNKAEELIRRCSNPHDDLETRDLFNIERRWYYMVFLHALTRYLDMKRLFDEFDENFDYARQSLLLYTRWAAKNEYPYLDKPEVLEYPTETWAAQEMRKSEVFDRASVYATPQERSHFLERARFFFNTSLDQLQTSTTAHFTRPTALLLTYGSIRRWFENNESRVPPVKDEAYEHPQPTRFVPQRKIVLARVKLVVLVTAGATIASVTALFL